MKIQCRNLLLFLAFFCFCCSCSKQSAESPETFSSQSEEILSIQAKDFAPGQLEAHYQKHADQFEGISQEEYLQQARKLLNSLVQGDLLEKVRSNGDVLRYKRSTGEFAVMTKTGRIRTYFKADWQYWMRQ